MATEICPITGLTKNDARARKTAETKLAGKTVRDMRTYRKYVKMWTDLAIKEFGMNLENYEKRGNHAPAGDAYHLDHVVSVHYGFHNNIPTYIIGDISNLKMLPWQENIQKSR